MGEIPHLQAAVSRLRSKKAGNSYPFEILNISADDDRTALVFLIERMNLPGIHTWDEKGRDNPVASLYNVRGLPSSYLLDADGVIKMRDVPVSELVQAIESVAKKTR